MEQTAQIEVEAWLDFIIGEVDDLDLYGPGLDLSYSFFGDHWSASVYNDVGGGMGHPSNKQYIARSNGDTLEEAIQELVVALDERLASGADSDD